MTPLERRVLALVAQQRQITHGYIAERRRAIIRRQLQEQRITGR